MARKIYDYIIIGAGTAGGIIAKELTDDKKTSVLVLEAGTNMNNELASPSALTSLVNATNNKYSFNVASILEQILGRQLILSGGRVIGGSSSHNAMLTVRGSRELYDQWADLVANEQNDGSQWKYENLRSLFIQNETYTGETQSPNERGRSGPIFVRQQRIPNDPQFPNGGLIQTLARATSEVLNIPLVEDYNTGIGDCTFLKSQFFQQEVNGGFVRSSTATGYLNEAIVSQGNEFDSDEFGQDCRGLTILAKTTVDKVLLKKIKDEHVAVGAQFVKDGITQRAFARRGIIMSAGNFSSVILQRSGIGRRADLLEAGITHLVESPNVGHNFQTQFFAGMGVEVETNRLLEVLGADQAQPVALGAFKKADSPSRRLQLLGFPISFFVPPQEVITNGWEFNQDNPSNVMSLAISDLNPKSRGTILAAHSDPEAYPKLDFNPLDHPDDLNYMVDQYIKAFDIIQRARALDPGGKYNVVYPAESIFHLDETEKRRQLANYVRATYSNYAHFAGQCKMGRNIQEAVVDGFLNVFGVKNLKVADLSIAPIIPDGNTANAAQIIGLNAVRFIRMDSSSYYLNNRVFENFDRKRC